MPNHTWIEIVRCTPTMILDMPVFIFGERQEYLEGLIELCRRRTLPHGIPLRSVPPVVLMALTGLRLPVLSNEFATDRDADGFVISRIAFTAALAAKNCGRIAYWLSAHWPRTRRPHLFVPATHAEVVPLHTKIQWPIPRLPADLRE